MQHSRCVQKGCVHHRHSRGLCNIFSRGTNVLSCTQGRKSAQFVQIASKRRVPLLFLQNTNSVEEGGTKAGSGTVETAGLMHAVACSKVPKISLLVGDSIGFVALAGFANSPMPRRHRRHVL